MLVDLPDDLGACVCLHSGVTMTSENLKGWRERLHWSKARAARELGLSRTTYIGHESGEIPIRRTVELACAALALGIKPPLAFLVAERVSVANRDITKM